MNILPKLYTREFPLILCEVWGKAYARFLGRETQAFPRYVFVIRNGLVEAYRNEAMAKELNQLFYEKAKADPAHLERFAAEYRGRFEELECLWQKKFLKKDELRAFARKLGDFWQAIYASMYIPPDERFSQEDRARMADLRKRIGAAADEATHVILASLQHHYPGLGPLASYVRLQDLDRSDVPVGELKRLAQRTVTMVDDRLVTEEEFEDLKKRYRFTLEDIRVEAQAKEVRGQTACPGHAKGRVMRVLKREDVKWFEEGRVLVTTMTVPDFLPAMLKASAFVTDEGGITSHAAIVARELNKPCVIGTRIATQVLKEGDLVEVDAGKGIVRKLSA